MKIHNFKDSQKFEAEGFEIQNDFYLKQFGHLPHRISWKEDSKYQSSDRDLYILNKNNEEIHISEKRRKEDFDDILFEIWSNYNECKEGWALHSTADLLAYFLPSSTVLLEMQSLVKMLSDPINKIKKQVQLGTNRNIDIWIYGETYPATLVKTYNETYTTLSITFSEKQLKRLGIRFKRI